jgi:hypothetical protein
MATCPEFHGGFRLSRELFTLLVCCRRCPWSHGLQPKQLYHTCSVEVTPAPVQFPTQRPLVPSFTYTRLRTFHLAVIFNIQITWNLIFIVVRLYEDLLGCTCPQLKSCKFTNLTLSYCKLVNTEKELSILLLFNTLFYYMTLDKHYSLEK